LLENENINIIGIPYYDIPFFHTKLSSAAAVSSQS
jgi:hypothetical protein